MNCVFVIKDRNRNPVCYAVCNLSHLDKYEVANEIGTDMEVAEWDMEQSKEKAASILTAVFKEIWNYEIGIKDEDDYSKDLIYSNVFKESEGDNYISFDLSMLENRSLNAKIVELACPEDSESYL